MVPIVSRKSNDIKFYKPISSGAIAWENTIIWKLGLDKMWRISRKQNCIKRNVIMTLTLSFLFISRKDSLVGIRHRQWHFAALLWALDHSHFFSLYILLQIFFKFSSFSVNCTFGDFCVIWVEVLRLQKASMTKKSINNLKQTFRESVSSCVWFTITPILTWELMRTGTELENENRCMLKNGNVKQSYSENGRIECPLYFR